jgi:hypothetical protein
VQDKNLRHAREVYPIGRAWSIALLRQVGRIVCKQSEKIDEDHSEAGQGDLYTFDELACNRRPELGSLTVLGATHFGQSVTSQFQKGLSTKRDRIDLWWRSQLSVRDYASRTALVYAGVFVRVKFFKSMSLDVSRHRDRSLKGLVVVVEVRG